MIRHEDIIGALKTVYDPEIPVDIYELGLIYGIEEDKDNVKVKMTLTAPGCPVAGILPQQVADAAASIDGIGEVEVYLVWEPAWSASRLTDRGRALMGLDAG